MKKLFLIPLLSVLWACGGGEHKPIPAENTQTEQPASTNGEAENKQTDNSNNKGFGKFTNVEVGPLDEKMAAEGKKVSDMKCASCHRMDDKRLVGPGWAGVTERRTPEWIMNFVTNVDENLDKDPESMAMLEECLVRMPNQNLSDDDARHVLEFMRKNDGAK